MTSSQKNENAKLTCIVLAAGQGTRMKSPLPKVLHPVAGFPMITRVVQACRLVEKMEIRIVAGQHLKLIESVVAALGVHVHVQAKPLGTGNAVASADLDSIEGSVMIVNGDHPLMSRAELSQLLSEFQKNKLDFAVVTTILDQPKEFGRIIRQGNQLKAIVEAKDASHETLRINEVNTGIYFATSEFLQTYVPRIQNSNAKGEYYLTDLISLGIEAGEKVDALVGSKNLAFGVNNQKELAKATQICFRRKADALMDAGVLMLDPTQVYIEDSVEVQAGAVLWPQVFLRGKSKVGAFTAIENNCVVIDSEIGESVVLKANSYIEGSKIQSKASVGPFARLRPETEIGDGAHVGNFVEMKKVKFGPGAKAGHLTYLGDAEVGENSNIGCGTITCNYAVDRSKYKTIIGKDVFVGSDSQFVAPIRVGDGAVIAAGSTITKDVPTDALAVARGRQIHVDGWAKKQRKNLAERIEQSNPETPVDVDKK